MPRDHRPLIIAHRGASAYAPENTLPAFQMAIESGADGVELDVRLSKDGSPVVIHDRNLKRLAGRTDQISGLAATELASVDVGTHFNETHPKRSRAEFEGVGVPALGDVLALFADSKLVVHVELKIDKKRELKPLVNTVCSVIHDSPALSRIVLSSFRLTAIAEAKHILPSVRTSALFSPSIMKFVKRRRHMIALARAFGANEISLHSSLVTPKFAKLARDIGMSVNIWTCNSVKWVSRAHKLGINAVMTNEPSELLARREALLESVE